MSENNNPGHNRMANICTVFGLHPLVGFGMFIIDKILFGGEAFSGGISIPISIVVGIALGFACIFIQKGGTTDNWVLSIGKGMIIGILTAIPTSIMSFLFLPPAILGSIGLYLGNQGGQKQIE